jgi:tetratricopeptide (TPR) repeat protein
MGDTREQPMDKRSSEEQELAEILAASDGIVRHERLEEYLASRPSSGLAYLHLGLSYLLNRFIPDLELGLSAIVVFGGSSGVSRAEVDERLQRAEEHFRRALELDPSLTDAATTNIACVKLFTNRYGPAILYIEDLLKNADHPQTAALLRSYLGIAYREMGEYDIAMGLFHSLLDSDLRYVHRHLALTHLCKGELVDAQAELQEQLRVRDSEIDQLLLRAVTAEIEGNTDKAAMAYGEVALRWRHDGQGQILGINAARHAERLIGDWQWKLLDYKLSDHEHRERH